MLVTQWHEDYAQVDERRHGGDAGRLLSTTGGGGGDEKTGELSLEGTSLPLVTACIEEGLPLGWEVTVSGWNSEEEAVVLLEGLGLGDWVVLLGGSIHLGQNLLRKGLGDPRNERQRREADRDSHKSYLLVDVGVATGSSDSLGLLLGQASNVPVHGVVDDSDSWSHDD